MPEEEYVLVSRKVLVEILKEIEGLKRLVKNRCLGIEAKK